MPLETGVKLGPYEILSLIGAGGMGEVYKARDTSLDRTVAIKVLPEHVASDPDLQQRFEREAKTISSLTGISDLLAPDGTFIHPRAAERTKFCSAYNRPAPEAVTSAHADVEPTGAAAFRAFLRHRSTLVPFLRQPSLHSAARQPAGTGSAQILRSISPKSRRFR